ncbi:hypothetical protein ACFX13_019191 [Malus domestica]
MHEESARYEEQALKRKIRKRLLLHVNWTPSSQKDYHRHKKSEMVIIQENSFCNCLPRLIPSLFHLLSSKFPNHGRRSQSHYIMVEHPEPL